MQRQIGPPGDRIRGEVECKGVAAPEAQHLFGGVAAPDALGHEHGGVLIGHGPDFDLLGQLPPLAGAPRAVRATCGCR